MAKKGGRPVITHKVVREVPPLVRSDSRTHIYAQAMAKVRKSSGRGKPIIIAEFTSPTGAMRVRRMMLRGERPIDGKLTDWDIQARRHGEGSRLYVTLK